MLFAVIFEDNPAVDATTIKELMPKHVAYLEATGKVREAGPLRNATGAREGGMWVVEASSFTDVDDLVKNDPFFGAGLRKSIRISEWAKGISGGKSAQ